MPVPYHRVRESILRQLQAKGTMSISKLNDQVGDIESVRRNILVLLSEGLVAYATHGSANGIPPPTYTLSLACNPYPAKGSTAKYQPEWF